MSGAHGRPGPSTGTKISLAVALVVLVGLVVILLRIPGAVRPTLISPSGAGSGAPSSAGARPSSGP